MISQENRQQRLSGSSYSPHKIEQALVYQGLVFAYQFTN